MMQRIDTLCVFLILSISTPTICGFSPTRSSTTRLPFKTNFQRNHYFSRLNVVNKNDSDSISNDESASAAAPSSSSPEKSLSFDDATQAIREEEDKTRMDARGMDLDQDAARMEANKSNFDRMREQIRSRAKDLNVSKSVATVDAIKQATARAMNPTDTPSLDLSKIGGDLLDTSDEDDLPDDVKRDLDKVGQLSLWEQAMDEFKNTRFPSMDATLKQAILMIVIFAVTATLILKVDEWLRILYTSWGFIPKSGEIMDYSNLALPEGFTDQMTEADVTKM